MWCKAIKIASLAMSKHKSKYDALSLIGIHTAHRVINACSQSKVLFKDTIRLERAHSYIYLTYLVGVIAVCRLPS